MKTKHLLLIALLGFFGISAYTITEDIIARLGMAADYAQYSISGNLIGRFDKRPMDANEGDVDGFKIPYARLLPTIMAGDKVNAAKELCDYTKKYINSEEFAAYYITLKEAALPLRANDSNGYSLGILRENLAVFELNIKNYPSDAAYVTEQKKEKEATQKSIDYLLEAAKKTFPNKELWEKTYPANPEVLVRKRLQEYLTLVATVDFDAKLTEPDKYKKRKFVNPVYEKKNEQWKAYYRAGKEVNEVMTSFAQEWLKGEIISSVKTKMSTISSVANSSENNGPVASASADTNVDHDVQNNDIIDNNDENAKPKKSLLGKLKDKAKSVIKD